MEVANKPEAVQKFLKELSDLTKRYGVEISGCGCCGSPAISMCDSEQDAFVDVGRFLEFDGEKYTIEEL